MNGFSTLLLLLVAQVSTPAQVPQSTGRDYGWDIDKSGNLFYIVQLSPTEVGIMQETNTRIAARQRSGEQMRDPRTGRPVIQPEEVYTDMPRELIGRVSRITVRIGDAILPRNPPLREIKARFPLYNADEAVASAIGRGNFADIESNKIVNAQNDGGLPPANYADMAAQLANEQGAPLNGLRTPALPPRNNASSSLLDATRGNTGAARNSTQYKDTAALPPFPNSGTRPSSTAQSTASTDPLRDPLSEPLWNLSDRPAASSRRDDVASRATQGRAPAYDRQGSLGVAPASGETPFGNRPPRYPASDPRSQDPASIARSTATGAAATYANENRQDAQWQGANPGYANANSAAPRTPLTSQNPNYNPNAPAGPAYQPPAQGPPYAPNPQLAQSQVPNGQVPNGQVQQQPIYGNYGYGPMQMNPYNQFVGGYNPGFPPAAGASSFRDPEISEIKDSVRALLEESKKEKEEDKRLPSTSPSEAELRLAANTSASGRLNGLTPEGTAGNNGQEQEPESAFTEASNAFARIFFLVSLVANCYLVYLIRKLLLRYRSLLTTVRTHAIS